MFHSPASIVIGRWHRPSLCGHGARREGACESVELGGLCKDSSGWKGPAHQPLACHSACLGGDSIWFHDWWDDFLVKGWVHWDTHISLWQTMSSSDLFGLDGWVCVQNWQAFTSQHYRLAWSSLWVLDRFFCQGFAKDLPIKMESETNWNPPETSWN